MLKKKDVTISPELLKKSSSRETELNDPRMLCENLSFAGAEAYKMLRTNLLFSLPDEQKCRVIGITSSVSGEGKSTTAINLAYVFAQAGKSVLLLEADMRRPNIARRLQLKSTPGLSNLLAGMSDAVIQQSKQHTNLYVISAGDVPPNPSEMLGSNRMKNCIETLAQRFDFIFVDLPPVNVVTDALSLCRIVDGFVFVIRQDYSTRAAIRDAVRQLDIVGAKVLGFVMNSSGRGSKNYRQGKYGKYGKNYSNHYYETSHSNKSTKAHMEKAVKEDEKNA